MLRRLETLLALLAACGACTPRPALQPVILPHPNRPGWLQASQMTGTGTGIWQEYQTPEGRLRRAEALFGTECPNPETALDAVIPIAPSPLGALSVVVMALRCRR